MISIDIDFADRLLNDFAIRAFRDIADHDYIAARLAYRHGLLDQFLWSGEQAIEKYLKGILLFNRIRAVHLRHDLTKALELINQESRFKILLSAEAGRIFQHLDNYGRFRYFETSPYMRGGDLVALDLAVWEIRRYCQFINYKIRKEDGTLHDMLPIELEAIVKASERPPHSFSLGGELEKIVANKKHPARAALIHKNFRYGSRSRRRLSMRVSSASKNSPLLLHPEMLKLAAKFVYLPGEVIKAYTPAMNAAIAAMPEDQRRHFEQREERNDGGK